MKEPRKTIARLAAATLTAGLLGPCTALAVPLNGLIGLYTFDAADGTDSSGANNHGTVGTGVGFTATGGGVDGGIAADFSVLSTGANPTANAANAIVLPIDINASSLPQLTMGAWVRPDTTGEGGAGKVFSHDNGSFDRTLGIDPRSGGPGYALFTGTGVLNANPVVPFVLGDWQFIAARYDGATARLTVGGTTLSATDNTDFDTGFGSLFVGANPFFNEDFDGLVDNVFVYDRALTDQELDDIRLNGVLAQNVPEPGVAGLLLAGLVLTAVRRRRSNP
ncbi:MAG: LamG domain-containing protein [Chromatiales bacterium]|nr:LamG domain-containing protein [Chromatiales bacterium]